MSNHHQYTHPLPLVLKRRPQSPCPYKSHHICVEDHFLPPMRSKGIIPLWLPLCEIGYVGDEAFFLLLHHPPAALYQPRGRGRPTPPLGPHESSHPAPIIIFSCSRIIRTLKKKPNSATTVYLLLLPPKFFGILPGTRTHVGRKNLM